MGIYIYTYVYIKNFGTIRNRITVEIIVHYKIYRWFCQYIGFVSVKCLLHACYDMKCTLKRVNTIKLETPQLGYIIENYINYEIIYKKFRFLEKIM